MPTAPCFYIQEGDRKGSQVDLTHFPFTVGRARECDFVVDSDSVSRLHARFDFDHQQVTITDLGSANGTYLNNEILTAHKPLRLRAGDSINIGKVALLVFDDPATTAQISQVRLPTPGLRLDEMAAQVYVKGQRLDPPLSPSQFSLMVLLVHNEDAVVSREDVKRYVWSDDEAGVNDQTIDALVSRLRKRLSELDSEHEYIITRRGFGLMFQNRRTS